MLYYPMKRLTEKTFFYYLKCPNWVRRDVVHGKNLDQLEARLIDDGLLPEVMKKLLLVRGEYVTVEDEDVDDAFRRTLDFMRQGARAIYGGVLVDGHWVGRPDVLERVEGKSDLGGYYYVAVDIKRVSDPRGISDGHRMQGAFYADLLLRVQGVKPTSGYVMTPNGVVMRYDLESFAADYHLTLNDIEHILDGDLPLHVLTSGCKSSPYFSVCVDETESCDDLSLLNRVQVEEIEELNRAGVKTVMELATGDVAALSRKLIEMTDDRLLFLHRQARALKERVHDVVEPVELPSSNVELYFDIESDPVRDLDYLFGVLKVERTKDGSVTDTFHAFLAESGRRSNAHGTSLPHSCMSTVTRRSFTGGTRSVSAPSSLTATRRAGRCDGELGKQFRGLERSSALGHHLSTLVYSLKDIAQYLGSSGVRRGIGVESIGGITSGWSAATGRCWSALCSTTKTTCAPRDFEEWLEKQRPGA